MASSSVASPPLTDHDHSLIRKCEDAVRDGIALAQWCRAAGGDRAEFRLDLRESFRLPNRADGYFGSLDLNGIEKSVMGCRQYVEFARVGRQHDAKERLKEFVLGEFLSRAHWINPDGAPGGFDVERSLFQTSDGEYGKFPDDQCGGAMHWQDIGTRFQWVLLTIMLNDFLLNMGPIRRRMAEAVCVLPLPEFKRVVDNPSPEYALEVSIGYPFIDYAPIPNFFGFGPGKFGIAVKLFSFYLTHDNRIRAVMEFAAAPRAQKVFDFFGLDPVYGGADLLHQMSMDLFDPQVVHDVMDTEMLVEHCHVHQKLMDGTARIWEDWLEGHAS